MLKYTEDVIVWRLYDGTSVIAGQTADRRMGGHYLCSHGSRPVYHRCGDLSPGLFLHFIFPRIPQVPRNAAFRLLRHALRRLSGVPYPRVYPSHGRLGYALRNVSHNPSRNLVRSGCGNYDVHRLRPALLSAEPLYGVLSAGLCGLCSCLRRSRNFRIFCPEQASRHPERISRCRSRKILFCGTLRRPLFRTVRRKLRLEQSSSVLPGL